MANDVTKLILEVNRTVFSIHDVFSELAEKYGMTYNELMVIYAFKDNECVTAKQIRESRVVTEYAVNKVLLDMCEREIVSKNIADNKTYTLTEYGKKYTASVFRSIENIEAIISRSISPTKVVTLTAMLNQFDNILNESINKIK